MPDQVKEVMDRHLVLLVYIAGLVTAIFFKVVV